MLGTGREVDAASALEQFPAAATIRDPFGWLKLGVMALLGSGELFLTKLLRRNPNLARGIESEAFRRLEDKVSVVTARAYRAAMDRKRPSWSGADTERGLLLASKLRRCAKGW
jgi:hypothetical protein